MPAATRKPTEIAMAAIAPFFKAGFPPSDGKRSAGELAVSSSGVLSEAFKVVESGSDAGESDGASSELALALLLAAEVGGCEPAAEDP